MAVSSQMLDAGEGLFPHVLHTEMNQRFQTNTYIHTCINIPGRVFKVISVTTSTLKTNYWEKKKEKKTRHLYCWKRLISFFLSNKEIILLSLYNNNTNQVIVTYKLHVF